MFTSTDGHVDEVGGHREHDSDTGVSMTSLRKQMQ